MAVIHFFRLAVCLVAIAAGGLPILAWADDRPASNDVAAQADESERSRPLPVRFYSQYQSVEPSPPTSSSPAFPAPGNPGGPVRSLSEPLWVAPSQAPAQAQEMPGTSAPQPVTPSVTVPAPSPIQAPTPAAPPAASPSDLVVVVNRVQVVGATPELETVALRTVRTQSGGETSETQLRQDVQSLLATGFFSSATYTTKPTQQGLDVVFQVQPTIVQSLQLAGAQVLTPQVANQLFAPQLGQPISPTQLTQAVQRVNQWYTQNGYPLGRVLTVEPTREGVLIVTVAEGAVGDIRIRFLNREGSEVDANGNPIPRRTQEGFVRQQIQLKPGQVFREDLVRQDLQRLAQLGIFESATVSLEGDARRVNVIYNLVEAKTRGFNFGGGFNDDLGLYGTVNFQDTNFGGLAQQLNVNVQAGLRDVLFDGRFLSPYRRTDPDTPGYGANIFRRSGVSRVFDDGIRLPNDDRVRERRLGAGLNLDYPVGPTWMGSLGINYTNISIRDRDGDLFKVDEQGNPLSFSGTGIDDLYTLSFSAVQDLRDNVRNPGNGSLITLRTEQSIPIGRGEILSNRLEANYSRYIPIDLIKTAPINEQFPEVFAFNVQAGTVIGDLPPYNAYVLGGLNSVRGYETGGVATSRSYLQATAEYRFPIYRFIGGTLFADFATDLGSSDDVLGEPGIKRGRPGSGLGVGAGVRINSPIGIIRADFGINDQGDSRLQFGFGQRF